MAGTVKAFTGFEVGSVQEFYASSGTPSFSGSPCRSGGSFSLSVTSGPSVCYVELTPPVSGQADLGGTIGSQSGYFAFYFRYVVKASTGSETIAEIRTSLGVVLRLELDTTGVLKLYDSTDTLIDTGTTVLLADTWYRIDVGVVVDASDTCTVKLEETEELSGTGTFHTGAAQIRGLRLGRTYLRSANLVSYVYDDAVMLTGDWMNSGSFHVSTRIPWSVEVAGDWTDPSITQDDLPGEIDEAPPDDATSYCRGGASDTEARFEGSIVQGISDVYAVMHLFVAAYTGGGSIDGTLVSGFTAVEANGGPPGSGAYAGFSQVFAMDPATAIAWTVDGANAVRWGFSNPLSQAIRVTAARVHLLHGPITDLSGELPVLPCLYLLSDYPSFDTGSAGGYDPELRYVFPDLDFGAPDRVKIMETVELTYESLREIPLGLTLVREAPLTETGTLREESTATTQATSVDEPGCFWGEDWTHFSFATLRKFRAIFEFEIMQGKSFTAFLQAETNLTPFRPLQLVFRYTIEGQPQLGSGVLR